MRFGRWFSFENWQTFRFQALISWVYPLCLLTAGRYGIPIVVRKAKPASMSSNFILFSKIFLGYFPSNAWCPWSFCRGRNHVWKKIQLLMQGLISFLPWDRELFGRGPLQPQATLVTTAPNNFSEARKPNHKKNRKMAGHFWFPFQFPQNCF